MDELNQEIASILKTYTNEALQELIHRMVMFADKRLGKKESNYQGREKLDFAYSVFEKALSGIRNWNREKYDFEHFLFGVLKSEFSDYYEKQKRRKPKEISGKDEESYIIDIPVFVEEIGYQDDSFNKMDFDKQKSHYVNLLKKSGADELEMLIFECWCDDIFKPIEIAELLEITPEEVYNATKRLKNRRRKLNEIR